MKNFINNIRSKASVEISAKPLDFHLRTQRTEDVYAEYRSFMLKNAGINSENALPTHRVMLEVVKELMDQTAKCEEHYASYLISTGIVRSLSFVRCHRALDRMDNLANTLAYMLKEMTA